MGRNIDVTMIQCRMLNTSRGRRSIPCGPAKKAYQFRMKEVIENQAHLIMKQQEATKIIVEDGKIIGVQVMTGAIYSCKTCIICTDLFKGKGFYGGGPVRQRTQRLVPGPGPF